MIDEDGLILTNNHVVAGATKITVALYAEEEGAEYDARVLGRDPLTDSALIELTEKTIARPACCEAGELGRHAAGTGSWP